METIGATARYYQSS